MFSGKRQRRATTFIPVPNNHVPFYRLLMGPFTPLIRIHTSSFDTSDHYWYLVYIMLGQILVP